MDTIELMDILNTTDSHINTNQEPSRLELKVNHKSQRNYTIVEDKAEEKTITLAWKAPGCVET